MEEGHKSIFETPLAGVRGLLAQTADEEQACWSRDDLAAVFGHQWSAPLAVDLGGLEESLADRVRTLATAKGLLLRSFGDLLRHKDPPLALLELSKEFAKRSLHSPHASIPHDVARVLYFASIAAALSRCERRITTLSDDEITEGISWALSRDWVTAGARDVLSAGLEAVHPPGAREE